MPSDVPSDTPPDTSIDIGRAEVIGPIFDLWEELLGVPDGAERTAVLDQGTGWAPTLSRLDAATASRPVAPGGTSIAAHTAHAAAYLEAFEATLEGQGRHTAGPETFHPAVVDEVTWRQCRERLLAVAARVGQRLRDAPRWRSEQVRGAAANLAHLAYHLGAVRQMLIVVRG